ncbi:MAG: DEAD/DEAH box helicase family protein [Sulfurisoma sp.]|nr:DEAD/DEAH box helicase family protein [Sulfurisoma sp.]
MNRTENPLALAAGLTAKTNQLCIGLEDGVADIYDLVTPTTAELLRWWFLADICATRPFNYHAGQRQAILNTIVAHEVLNASDLIGLYRQAAPDALLTGGRLAEVSQSKHAHPKYCLKMATGTGKTWVMQAVMVWSLLNRTAAQAAGIDDPRFTRHFLIVAPGLIVYERLLDALRGKLKDGERDFSSSDVARYAELFIPEGERELVFGFVRGNVCIKDEIGLKATGNGLIAVTNWHALVEGEEEGPPEMDTPGAVLDPQQIIAEVLPLAPGKSAGNSLKMLESDFARLDPARHPKMLVVCEDTSVSPEVTRFLRGEGLFDEEVMTIDSGRKAELGEKEWAPVRERLFDVDRHASPRVIVSVLMLREGFDVNNICVIVPLRSSQAQILLEQTIGRGLRLMWREEEFADIKRENRERINQGHEPAGLIDILSIVEHPAFQSFYDELMQEGLAGTTSEDGDDTSSAGDMISVGLRDGFEEFDFAIPFILREAEETLDHRGLDVMALPPFTAIGRAELSRMLGKGDTFVSQDLQSATLFGDYRVEGAVMNVAGYNDYLARLTRRIGQALSQPLSKGRKVADHHANPYMQVNMAELTGWLEYYIRERLFAEPFEPLIEENWRLLLLQPVVDHITEKFSLALVESEQRNWQGETEVRPRRLSEVTKLTMRESASMPVGKCIYERLPFPTRSGGLERAFMEWAQTDGSVAAFCKISETRHDFARLRYVKEDGLPAFYSPDFLVRAEKAIYLVETKAQQQTIHPNVQRKFKAATAWCERINELAPEYRDQREWRYVLLGEAMFYDWRGKGGRLAELLDYARVRLAGDASAQLSLV